MSVVGVDEGEEGAVDEFFFGVAEALDPGWVDDLEDAVEGREAEEVGGEAEELFVLAMDVDVFAEQALAFERGVEEGDEAGEAVF